jgi:hypothetical protein
MIISKKIWLLYYSFDISPEEDCAIPSPRLLKLLLITMIKFTGSRGSAVGIATDYGLDDRGVGVRVLLGSRIFCSPRSSDRF